MAERALVLHLGLHKTATTTLQKDFFPQATGYLGFFYKGEATTKVQKNRDSLASELKQLAWGGPAMYENIRPLLRQIDFETIPVRVLSDEGLSSWLDHGSRRSSRLPIQEPTKGETIRRGVHPIVPFLAEVKASLPTGVALRTVVTLRAQPEYLASLAAQRASTNFDQDLAGLMRRKDEYIYWHKLVMNLEDTVGSEHHLTLLFEDGVEQNARSIAKFAGLSSEVGSFSFDFSQPHNVRRTEGSNTWENKSRATGNVGWHLLLGRRGVRGSIPGILLRPRRRGNSGSFAQPAGRLAGDRDDNYVTLTEEQRQRIREYCRESNQFLAEHLGRDLTSLGY